MALAWCLALAAGQRRPWPRTRTNAAARDAAAGANPGPSAGGSIRGRNAVRQCTSWLATEYRPSGTVIVPRMRCWWERG